MRWLWMVPTAALALALAGCATPRGRGAGPGPAAGNTLIVVPSASVRGKVAVVNPGARYVILSYPLGQMPAPEQRLAVYRLGLKVAEIKVGPQRIDTHAVADILAGECQAGDEVRAE